MTIHELSMQITLKAMELGLIRKPLPNNYASPEEFNEAMASAIAAFYTKIFRELTDAPKAHIN